MVYQRNQSRFWALEIRLAVSGLGLSAEAFVDVASTAEKP